MGNHVESSNGLKYLFYPRSVAIIGASRSPGKIGHEILRNIIGFGYDGKIFPVNPHADEILGYKAYPSIVDVPDEVDLAVISVPARIVPKVLEDCGRKGVKVVVIISSGFSEVGNVEAERKVVEIARKYGMRILGPNVFGVLYTPSKLNATFGPMKVRKGNIAFISQSGALGIALMGWTFLERIGLSAVVSVGNKADIEDADLLDFFVNDPNSKVILIYMEGLKNGRRFLEVAKRVSKVKPIIVLKAGRSERGALAAASHTGSLAGSDEVYSAAFRQAGVLRAKSIQEAFDWARTMVFQPPPINENVVVITNGGGAGVIAADACEEYELHLMDLPEDLANEFRKFMPPFGSVRNPIDLTGEATEEAYAGAVKVALEDPRIGAILVIYCHTAITDPGMVARAIVRSYIESRAPKPLVVSFIGGVECYEGLKLLNDVGVPAYPSPDRAASSLGAYYRWARYARIFEK